MIRLAETGLISFEKTNMNLLCSFVKADKKVTSSAQSFFQAGSEHQIKSNDSQKRKITQPHSILMKLSI